MTKTPEPQTNKTPRLLKFALIVSLAVNLGVAGIVGGAALRSPDRIRGNTPPPLDVAMLARAMPFEHQRALRKEWSSRHDTVQSNRRVMVNLRNQLISALKAEPFEIEAVNEVLIKHREIINSLTANGHNAIVEQIEKMSPEDRSKYIQRLLGKERIAPRRQ